MKITTLDELTKFYNGTPENQKEISEEMCLGLLSEPRLYEFRRYIRDNIFGFGEDEFIYMWKLIIEDLMLRFPEEVKFCEIGVFKGQILAAVKMIFDKKCKWSNPNNNKLVRYGVTPLSSDGIGWVSDYGKDIEMLHDKFFLKKDYNLIVGHSALLPMIQAAKDAGPFHVLYIDGSHEYIDVVSDLIHYLPMIAPGGYLVVDDCNNNMPFVYNGRFWGIQEVSNAVDERLPPISRNDEFEYLFSVIHNRIFRKR